MKVLPLLFVSTLAVATLACHGPTAGTPPSAGGRAEPATAARGSGAMMLSRDEVAAILGKPVTSVEGRDLDLTYKTDVLQLETSIEVDEKSDTDDAKQAMEGARTATGLLGGKPEAVAQLGDDAFFGAMSVLYMRKGDRVVTITPPNLQMVAGIAAYGKVASAPLGSPEQRKAMDALQNVEKTDPLTAGANTSDAVQGTMATIKATSVKNGSSYETDSRAMALALAAKLVAKL